ncbi:unnamed protein product [Toxocara canis]|uniref:RNA-directed RNA polymerase n=1 Tax=Toxocara canis TaxID=6265 RepID=A0A183VF51_TOXCA|nr:unnamed protein product [Toxocara canis]
MGKTFMATCTDGQAVVQIVADRFLKLLFLDGGNCTDLLEKHFKANACIFREYNVQFNAAHYYARVVPRQAVGGFNLSHVLDRVCRLLSIGMEYPFGNTFTDNERNLMTFALECGNASAVHLHSWITTLTFYTCYLLSIP